jgi:hypothetical protein
MKIHTSDKRSSLLSVTDKSLKTMSADDRDKMGDILLAQHHLSLADLVGINRL